MTWQKVLLYVLGGVVLIALGWLLHSSFIPKPTIEVKETIKYDTITVTKRLRVVETKIIEKPIYTDSSRYYRDSIQGIKNEITYKITHSITDNKKVISDWSIDLLPKIKWITKVTVRDSIRTVIQPEFITKPFFLDMWFYTSIVFILTTVLAIIF